MHLSNRMRQMKPSATLAINARVQALRKEGRKIVSLAVGEPDFATPEHVCRAAIEAIEAKFTRYTPVAGIAELREAVAAYFNRFYAAGADAASVIVGNGGKQILYNLFQCLLNPGDEVIVPSPYWVSYPYMIRLAAAEPVYVRAKAENGFKIKIEDLKQAVGPKSRILLLNSPSNPTGAHYTQEELEELAAFALSRDLFIISDEIYDQLVYAPAQRASLCALWRQNPRSVAIVNGLAKSFAMTGWRVGYCLAHPDLIKAMSVIQGHSTSNVCSISQKAALAALTGPWDFVEEVRRVFAARRDLALREVGKWPGARCPRPDGAFYLFVKVDSLYNEKTPDSTAICARILEEAGVGLVPGVEFGDDDCFRLSYAVDDQTLAESLAHIGEALKRL